MIRNLKVNNRVLFTMCLSGVMILSSGCTDVESSEDFNKSFNVVVENNDDKISVVGIKAYSNYGDNQIQFVTNDDLKVVSSISKVQLLKINDDTALKHYIFSISGNNLESVTSYDELQGIDINYEKVDWNKMIFGNNYSYDKAIILSDGVATVVNLSTCLLNKNKIQLGLEDGTIILTDVENVRLINDDEAKKECLKNYALSLVGDSDKVIFYDVAKSK